VGYTPSVLNAYACNVENQLLELANQYQQLGQRYKATEKIMTNPDILANYVCDFNKHVDGSFMNRVADYYEEDLRAAGQGQQQQSYPQQSGMQMAQPGSQPLGMGQIGQATPQMSVPVGGMMTPEMMVNNAQAMSPSVTPGMPIGVPNQPYGPQPLQPLATGTRPGYPAPPQQGQAPNQEDIWASIRQTFATNPGAAFQMASQYEARLGHGALAKPLIAL
jgi:hypothetical protein